MGAQQDLDVFATLAEAVGLTLNGELQGQWFQDPLGTPDGSQRGLSSMMYLDEQREALIAFVDEVLGDPERDSQGEAIWVPLFRDSGATVFVVVRQASDGARVGFGIEYDSGSATPSVAVRAHVPVFQFEREGAGAPDTSGSGPDWLVLGRADARIEISLEVGISDDAPTPGELFIGGVSLAAHVPTDGSDDMTFSVGFRRLQLPGSSVPRDFELSIDSIDELDGELLEFLTGLIQAQAEALDTANPATAPFAALTGLAGLRAVPQIPPFPLEQLITTGIPAITNWLESILANTGSRNAWLGQWASLLGGSVNSARNCVEFSDGSLRGSVGLDVTSSAAGGLVITPWIEGALRPRTGAEVSAHIDLLTLETLTSSVTALPDLSLSAVFGQEAGLGSPLLSGDPALGSVRAGLVLSGGRPAFSLTAHDVVLAGVSHQVLDLSSPEAALDAAASLVDDALVAALESLGRPGEISALLLGLEPPAGISGVSAVDLLTDPLGQVSAYWDQVRGSAAAMTAALTAIQELITGSSTSVSGNGSPQDPWRIDLDPVRILVSVDGDWVSFDLQGEVEQGVLDGKTAGVSVEARLVRLNFSNPSVEFFSRVQAVCRLRTAGGDPLRLDLGPMDLVAGSLGVALGWSATGGLSAAVQAPELQLELESSGDASATVSVAVPIPEFHGDGSVTFAPDWDSLEQAIAVLLRRMESDVINVILELTGWASTGAHLSLGELVDDPGAALRSWMGDLVLNCGHVREAMAPLAYLMSGFREQSVLGTGNERAPFRAAIAGDSRAPGVAVWLDPGCAIARERYETPAGYFDYSEPPEPEVMAAALKAAGSELPDLADLMTGRDSLHDGFQALVDRLTGTDGLLGRPVSLPDGVTGVDIPGLSYRELVAYGVLDLLPQEATGLAPDSVLYVGCEEIWSDCFGTGSLDVRITSENRALPAADTGHWSVCLPDPAAAAAARPDRGAVEEQAQRLASVLADRTAPVTVVAYGGAGAAAIRAAATLSVVDHVITVGSPWSLVSLNGLSSGLSGDALRLLAQIRSLNEEALAEEEIAGESGPALQFGYVLDRAVAAAGFAEEQLGDLPRADEQPRRAGLPVHAVFAALDGDELETGLAELVADAIDYRYQQSETPETPPRKLHLGVDLPVFDADLGGMLVGAGAILELLTCDRGESGDSFAINTDRQLILDLHFGVHDGWLVGGPGAEQTDIEVRWLSARLYLPLEGSERVSGASFTLHEANCFGIRRERWVIENGAALPAPSLPTPEIHLIMAEVVARLSSASPALTDLLADLGLIQSGGYNPEGLDELLMDAGAALASALNSSTDTMAGAIRALAGFSGSGPEMTWSVDAATMTLNLETRQFNLGVEHGVADPVPLSLAVEVSASSASASAGLGAISPEAGGLRLSGVAGSGGAGTGLGLEWRLPGAPATRTIDLLSPGQPEELIRLAASLVPATLTAGLADYLRNQASEQARQVVETLLDSLGLLAPASEMPRRRIILPWALFMDPAAWLKSGSRAWAMDPFGQSVQTLNAMGQLLIPGFAGDGFRLSDEVVVGYGVDAGRLELDIRIDSSHSLGPTPVNISVAGGLSLTTSGAVEPVLETSVTFDGKGLGVTVSPDIRIDLIRAAPAAPMAVYPSGPGLGSLVSAGAGMAIPVVLNALIAERSNPSPSLVKDVAEAIFELGSALDLLDASQFADAKIQVFAADPAGVLLARLPYLLTTAVNQLATALDPTQTLVTAITGGAPGISRLRFGNSDPLVLTLDASSSGPAIEVSGFLTVTDLGTLGFDRVRISAAGVQVSVSYASSGFDLGNGLILRPVARVDAGISGTGFQRMAGIGLVTDGIGEQSIQFRWALDETPPRMALVESGVSGETENTDPAAVGLALLSQAISMAAGITLEAMGPLGNQAVDALQDVLFTGGTATLDPQLFDDFTAPEALLRRLFQLGFNLADNNLKITIDNKVDIGFTRKGNLAGISISLPENERIALASSDPTVDLEVVASWISSEGVAPGLSVFLVEKVGNSFELNAGFAIAGVGVRVGKNAGPLLNLGIMSIDAIAVHVYGEAVPAGLGAGIQVQLDGLAIIPSAAGGDNGVANSIMSDAGNDASSAARPAFSPALAIQKPPGQGLGISLSAGEAPGPWWLPIQRQLGPLYLEQFGFNVTEADGTVTGISLLFDARLSLFGLTASVEELGLHWLGGDLFELDNWAVDLQGLGVSGDFSGLSIAGGLLKTNLDGKIGYVGMLSGRFGVYGLSLFGGYNEDNGLPSFFVFGAIQGPIGGPPAFFLTGIGGGLGIKRGLRVPDDLSRFGEYPFIKALDPAATTSTDPLEELRQLAAYFPPEPGNFWFAAGISFTSFSLVDGIAVLSVSVGNGLELNLFGLARLALPRPQAALVSIELGLLARFSSREGLFLIQAQLTDNSWLLYPEVRLTGGFAFATWWLGPNAGQFVLTLGGYHPSFHRDGYPVVPRLGLQWRVSNAIVIKGESYFALTSEALMAGLSIEVSADFGFAWARIAFGANAIVYFDPFYFMADAYARISAGVKIKTFLGTIRFSISLGATIAVEGPEFHGRAVIEVGPCDITVKFGNTRKIQDLSISWEEFVGKYLEETLPGRARTLSGITGKGSLPAATDGDTSAPSSDGSEERPFEVFAEFEVSVVAQAPVTYMDFGHPGLNKNIPGTLPDGTGTDLGLSPMNASGLSGILKLRLEKWDGKVWNGKKDELEILVDGIAEEKDAGDGPSYGLEAFPIGVWGEPGDPDPSSSPLPKGDVIFTGSRVKLVAKADDSSLTGPEIDYYQVEKGTRPLPLSATGNIRGLNIGRAQALGLSPVAESVSDAFAQARQYLFAEAPAQSPDGLLANGSRSAKARAIYENSRTAPPLFGTLMDGLEAVNSDNVQTDRMVIDTGKLVRQPGRPYVSAVMTTGAGVASRPVTTTVADGRIKRRPAPSTESVRGRLGRSLPIKLNLTHAPPRISDQTVVLRGSVPRTSVAGISRSYSGGRVGSAAGNAFVRGLATGPGTQAPDTSLRAGDFVTLRCPDAAIDTGSERPGLRISGLARVVMLRGNGVVLHDARVRDNTIEVPPHTALIAIQASGGGDDRATGIHVDGWHDQSRLIRLSGRTALAAGCALSVNGASSRQRPGWKLAQDLVRGAASVSTRFSSPVTCIGVILKGAATRAANDVEIELYGASHRSEPVTPVVVQAGSRSILLFDIVPDRKSSGVSVRVIQGGAREVAGTIGAVSDADSLSELVAEKGLPATVSRLRAVSAEGCDIEWIPVPGH